MSMTTTTTAAAFCCLFIVTSLIAHGLAAVMPTTDSPSMDDGPFLGDGKIIGPCISGACPTNYDCKNNWCILSTELSAAASTTTKFLPIESTTQIQLSDDAPFAAAAVALETLSFDLLPSSSTPFGFFDDSKPSTTREASSVTELTDSSSTFDASSAPDYSSEISPTTTTQGDAIGSWSSKPSSSGEFETISPSSSSINSASSTTSSQTIDNSFEVTSEASDLPNIPTTTPVSPNFESSPPSLISFPSEISTATTTIRKHFEIGGPCIFGACSPGYECKRFWCIRSDATADASATQSSSSTSVTITPASTGTKTSSSSTNNPIEITGPCIADECPDAESHCLNGFCVKPSASSSPSSSGDGGSCQDKQFGCYFISYLCKTFEDLMNEGCAKTCNKC